MRMYDLIHKKRDGKELSQEEIKYIVKGYTEGDIPDYQMSALLMAIYFNSMTEKETAFFTNEVAHSGEMIDLSAIEGFKVDKHSTGGVGDKTTLIVAPIVASYGVKVAKMSGRGLGHTGGTVDKMEAIPGMKTTLSSKDFIKQVNDIGLAVIGQSSNLAPADKKLYALRDVTATVDSIPLIACSIMSKKIAAGNDAILLDVKTGSGAFMKTLDDSIELAKAMVSIGKHAGKKTVGLITEMDIPLGHMVGNSLEIMEVVDTLKGKGPKDLSQVACDLAANMLYLAGKGDIENCKQMAEKAIEDQSAFKKLLDLVTAQGGDVSYLEDTSKFQKADYQHPVKAQKAGYISAMDTEGIGLASVMLGAGRKTVEDSIDFAAGIEMIKKTGDYVNKGDTLAIIYTNDRPSIEEAEEKILASYTIADSKPDLKPLVLARVSSEGVEKF
ncbi:MAG: pyrimidine-nucleoside phosphorylase [Tissierellia bacterium]|nr:pyrimidine-nucleoside phosphorylase [Tissierellia bacterium]